jgi:pSer/pThr/pTyr-binding forkhead associated (FHA) protein
MAIADRPVVIGRSAGCDVALADPTVSKRHIELRRQGTDVVVIDLGSTNGTMVNGQPTRQHVLADGDTIQIGASTLTFEAR